MTESVQANRESAVQENDVAEAVRVEEGDVAPVEAVPASTPVIGGVPAVLFSGRDRVADDLGPSCESIVGAPGETAQDYEGWVGAPKLADALLDLAFGRAAPEDCAVRIVANSVASPIARRILPECAALAERGVRCAILLQTEPRQAEEFAPFGAISRVMGLPRLDDLLRIADFPGAKMCLEQAMIGDRFYWSGEPLARRRPTPLPAGSIVDLTRSKAAPDAARLRFAAAWRLAAEPSHELCRRVAAAARAV